MPSFVALIQGERPLPLAVVVLTVLHAAAALLFGVLAHADPGVQFPDLVTNDDGHFAAGLYANRNIAVGLGLVAGLALRSAPMLVTLFLIRFGTDAADLVMAFTQDLEAGEVVGQLVFFGLLFASEAYVLRRLGNDHIGAAHV